jgi:hypothetical protein
MSVSAAVLRRRPQRDRLAGYLVTWPVFGPVMDA